MKHIILATLGIYFCMKSLAYLNQQRQWLDLELHEAMDISEEIIEEE